MSIQLNNFGPLLRDLRERAGQHLGMLARALDMEVTHLSGVERGRHPALSEDQVLRVAQQLGLSAWQTSLLRESAARSRRGKPTQEGGQDAEA